ncbi:MAG: hypothetical protein Q7T51_04925 [Candidatus Moranbacteria bacterium]|nr:hypothetical protein [Candidatus Moranbacteria bacterium]
MKKITVFAIILILGLIVCTNNKASAQDEAKGFSITPFFREVVLSENSRVEKFELEVVNSRDFPAVFRISALDFGSLNETSGVAFAGSQDLNSKYNLASWISLERDAIVLAPGEKQIVRGTVENKEVLSPGGHYAAVVFKMENDGNDAMSNVDLRPSVASLIFVRKMGGEIYGLNLKEHSIARSFWGLPTAVRLRFQNTGNVHLSPRGTVKVADMLGREVRRGIINEESSLILPETFRVFPTNLRNFVIAFIPGMYNIAIDYRYDGEEGFMTQQQQIFVVPMAFNIFFLIVVSIIGVYFGIRYKLKSNAKTNKHKKYQKN